MFPLILLAEDEPLVTLIVQDALEEGGFLVRTCASGAEALAAIEDGAVEIAGMITDVRLGAGINGWELARIARKSYPGLPIVYISGDSAVEHTSQGVPNSIMIEKPFALAQVVTAISTLLNGTPDL